MRQHVVREVPVAARELLARASGAATRSAGETGIPSGTSCVRHLISEPSRQTIRSTVSLAIRRQVVSLPPVIVIIPDEVS